MRTKETGEARARRLIRRLDAFVRRGVRPLASDARLLELVGTLHAARDRSQRIDDTALSARLGSLARAAARTMRRALRRSPERVVLARAVRRHRLDVVETECLLLLAYAGIGHEKFTSLGDVQTTLAPWGCGSIRVLRALSPDGRLVQAKLVCVDEDRDGDVGCSRVKLHPDLFAELLGRRPSEPWRTVDSQEQLLERMRPLFEALADVAEEFTENDATASSSQARAVSRRDHLVEALLKTLFRHDAWGLARLSHRMPPIDFRLLVVMVGHELGHGVSNPDACTGRSIAAAVSDTADDVAVNMRRLRPDAWLRSEGLVRARGGEGDLANVDDAGAIATCTFELTDRAVKLLSLRAGRRKRVGARAPLVRLEQLVLGDRIDAAVRMALAQAKNADVL